MKKRLLALLLCLSMLLSFTVSTYAEGNGDLSSHGYYDDFEDVAGSGGNTNTDGDTTEIPVVPAPVVPAPGAPTQPGFEEGNLPGVTVCEECGAANGHTEDCSQYVAPKDDSDAKHSYYELDKVAGACKECGGVDGHLEGCSLYVALEEFDVEAAYEELLACESEEEVNAFLSKLSEEEAALLADVISEEEILALAERIGVSIQENIITPPKDYIEVGPLMPSVTVTNTVARRMLRLMAQAAEPENGLILSKKAERVGTTNEYKITLEAYTTGTVTSSSKAVPADIVLVLDESGSMEYKINQYTKVYTLKTESNYYVKSGDSYIQVSWCNGGLFHTHTGGWYSGVHFFFHWGTRYEPMTSATDTTGGHVQFYEASSADLTKRQALITSAKQFVQSVYDDATANNVDHRISVIGFSGNGAAATKIGLVDDIRTNKSSVDTAIDNLKADGGTYIEDGMALAEQAFDGAAPTTATTRNRIVVVFTDGIPGSGSWESNTISNSANPAISTSYTLKNTYGATVYTIGMLNDANPELEISDESNDSARTNKFLHYLSSNYPKAQSMSDGGTGSNAGYYLAASDTESLNKIFEKISQEIASPSISLDSTTEIRDIVSTYFDVPENTSAIKLYTANYTGENSFGDRNPANSEITADISGDTVSVEGFDFNSNFCAKNTDGSYRGKKLIIEFTVTPKDGFWGGNLVPTNGNTSGVYNDGEVVENFVVPTVNVPINIPAPGATDQNVYYGGAVPDADDLTSGVAIPTGDDAWKAAYVNTDTISYTMTETVSNTADGTYTITATATSLYPTEVGGKEYTTGTSTCKSNVAVYKPVLTIADSTLYLSQTPGTDYAENTKTVKWMYGETSASDVTMTGTAPTNFTYAFDKEITAFSDCTNVKGWITAVGSVAYNAAEGEKAPFTVHILKPTVTWKDASRYYGDTFPTSFTPDSDSTAWQCKDGNDQATNGTGAPTIAYIYTPKSTLINGLMPDSDVDVAVSAKIGETVIQPTYLWEKADGVCDNTCAAAPEGAQFRVHPKTCSLKVEKTGADDIDLNQAFIFNISGGNVHVDVDAVVVGNGSVTITGLPVGSYTVTEDENWSWRYTVSDGSATLDGDPTNSYTVTMKNTRDNPGWLSNSAIAVNLWNEKGTSFDKNPTNKKKGNG